MNAVADPAGRLWPNQAQTHLLKAALAEDRSAADHFDAWLKLVDIEHDLDEQSYRLIPLLWANLAERGVQHAELPRMKGVLRNSWVQSVRLAGIARRLLGRLGESGISTMVSKGLPLALVYYRKSAHRPMSDLDIVVRPEDVKAADAILRAEGFEAEERGWSNEFALRHALMYRHPELGEIDLHWHVLFETPNRAADAHFWAGAVPLDIGGVTTLRPSATDLLLHVVVHGVRWNMAPPMRWIADSTMILRSADPVDWDRLIRFARNWRLSQRLALGLGYLRGEFGLAVPVEAIDRLRRDAGLVERVEMLAMRGADDRSRWRHLRRASFLLRYVSSDHARHLPRALLSELRRRYGARRQGRRDANLGAGSRRPG